MSDKHIDGGPAPPAIRTWPPARNAGRTAAHKNQPGQAGGVLLLLPLLFLNPPWPVRRRAGANQRPNGSGSRSGRRNAPRADTPARGSFVRICPWRLAARRCHKCRTGPVSARSSFGAAQAAGQWRAQGEAPQRRLRRPMGLLVKAPCRPAHPDEDQCRQHRSHNLRAASSNHGRKIRERNQHPFRNADCPSVAF